MCLNPAAGIYFGFVTLLDAVSLFPGTSETETLCRALDWSRTPVGGPETWSTTMRTIIRTSMASAFPICTWWGPELTLVYNDPYRAILGDKHPAIGRPGHEVWREIWPTIAPLFEHVLSGGPTVWAENQPYTIERSDGPEEVTITFSLSPICDDSGTIIGLYNVVTETTEQVRAQQRAEAAVRRTTALQSVTASLSRSLTPEEVADVVLDYASEILGVCSGSVAIMSQDRRQLEVVGTRGYSAAMVSRYHTVYTSDSFPLADAARTAIPVVLRSTEERERRYPHLAALRQSNGDGAMVALPTAADGGVLGALGFNFPPGRVPDADDLSFLTALAQQAGQALQRARLFQTERALRAEAEAANQTKADFLAVMSHELRTPLNAVAGHAELLMLGVHGPVTDAQIAALERIKRSGRHLLGLINDILNYAKVEAGSVELHVADVAAEDMLGRLDAIVGVQATQRQVSFSTHGCPGLTIRADSEKVQQILLNLCANALTATDAGGSVRVSCAEQNGAAAFIIEDTGIGIAQDKLDAIFEPFVQINRGLTSQQGGTGLGLAISRDLARAMGGDITATSVVGEGSVFTVTLPLASNPIVP